MKVYWLEQTGADVPDNDDWLSAAETRRLDGLRFPKRREDWRLGRWTAKRAVAVHLGFAFRPETFRRIEIRPAESGAPEVAVGNLPAGMTVSLSHRAGRAACAITGSGAALGCDLEIAERRSDAFIEDYFTAEEQLLIESEQESDRPRLPALLWSAKESALKALTTGLRRSTHSVVVSTRPSSCDQDWIPLSVRCTSGETLHGWWQSSGTLVRTVVAAPAPQPPILLCWQQAAAAG